MHIAKKIANFINEHETLFKNELAHYESEINEQIEYLCRKMREELQKIILNYENQNILLCLDATCKSFDHIQINTIHPVIKLVYHEFRLLFREILDKNERIEIKKRKIKNNSDLARTCMRSILNEEDYTQLLLMITKARLQNESIPYDVINELGMRQNIISYHTQPTETIIRIKNIRLSHGAIINAFGEVNQNELQKLFQMAFEVTIQFPEKQNKKERNVLS